MNGTSSAFPQDPQQVGAVGLIGHRPSEPLETGRVDVSHPERDLLDAGDFQPLSFFDGPHERRRLQEGLVRSGVEPGDTPTEALDVQALALEVCAISVRDIELTSGRPTKPLGDLNHLIVDEVQSRHCVRRTWCRWFLFESDYATISAEFDDSIPAGAVDT